MKTEKQNPDFLSVGQKLLNWYFLNGRILPFRSSDSPYLVWISEVIFQQTRIAQGMDYYQKFIKRFPTMQHLAEASVEEVQLYWKGLGYYSRAINLHKAAQVIVTQYNGSFPKDYSQIIRLPGIGQYTAAAIASICFGEVRAAIDGNFYRVLSRFFCDDYDISKSSAFQYFELLALRLMPKEQPGNFNQAVMDLGAMICTPKKPACNLCPIAVECSAYPTGKMDSFPVKSKKTTVKRMSLDYYFVYFQSEFVCQQRDHSGIWKNLFEFPTLQPKIPSELVQTDTCQHRLTHLLLEINIHTIKLNSALDLEAFCEQVNGLITPFSEINAYSWPKPLDKFLSSFIQTK